MEQRELPTFTVEEEKQNIAGKIFLTECFNLSFIKSTGIIMHATTVQNVDNDRLLQYHQ